MATVQKRGDSFRIRSSCGYDINGRQIVKSMTWTPAPGMTPRQIEKELERQKILFDEKCRAGLCLDDNITLRDFCEKWLAEYADPNLAPKTVAGYRDRLRRVYAAIGHKKLSQIKPAHIMEFYQNLRESGIRGDIKYVVNSDLKAYIQTKKLSQAEIGRMSDLSVNTVYQALKGSCVSSQTADKISTALGMKKERIFVAKGTDKPLSDKTISEYHRLLHVIFKTAMQWQYLSYNPCDMVTPPKTKKTESIYLDEKQTADMLHCLENEPIKPRTMILMLLYSGLRRGELCGLFWEDIDSKRKLLTVKRSTQYLPERGIFDKDTKTESSNRTIRLPDIAFTVLDEYRIWQNAQRTAMGDQWSDTGRVFCDDYGRPISPEYISAWFYKFVRRHDLPHIHVHSLRHTNATLMIAGGVPLRTVSARLGHAQMSTTANIYTHAIQSADEAAADTLQDMLAPVKKKINEEYAG